jgi:hypothetical protein
LKWCEIHGVHARESNGSLGVKLRLSARHGLGSGPIEEGPGAVNVAPLLDVRPVEGVTLDADHVANIVSVFASIACPGPAKLGDDDIFRRCDVDFMTADQIAPPACKSLAVMGIIAQQKEFNSECRFAM